jgi:hypothetical protein
MDGRESKRDREREREDDSASRRSFSQARLSSSAISTEEVRKLAADTAGADEFRALASQYTFCVARLAGTPLAAIPFDVEMATSTALAFATTLVSDGTAFFTEEDVADALVARGHALDHDVALGLARILAPNIIASPDGLSMDPQCSVRG